jgi:hypothetical protein
LSKTRCIGLHFDYAAAAKSENGFFLANVAQGLLSASAMKKAGRSNKYIFRLWISIVLMSGVAAATGYLVLAACWQCSPVRYRLSLSLSLSECHCHVSTNVNQE